MGKRGEGWVIIQAVLFLIIIFAPRVELSAFPPWLNWSGFALMALGGLLGLAGLFHLGSNITPFPKPVAGGKLVTSGAYAIVRHPIYSGLTIAALGWALWNSNLLGILLAFVLFVFFDMKSRREERWLAEAYPDYGDYRRRIKKLIPWLY